MTSDHQPGAAAHPELRIQRDRLRRICDSIPSLQPPLVRLPVIDSSVESATDSGDEIPWLQQENITGLKKLQDSVKTDLDLLDKFLDDPESAHLPPPSTNAPYLIAVWNELVCTSVPVSIFKSFPLLPYEKLAFEKKRTGQKPQGTKVDIVAEDGKKWIRVNTVKNPRLLSEFREMDSYLTDSDGESGEGDVDNRPSLASMEFDNSVLKMGRALLETAKANPLEGTAEVPKIMLCLTRLDLSPTNKDFDERLTQTVALLREMGIDVRLGDRGDVPLPESLLRPVQPSPPPFLKPTRNVNLDLSILIALVSDLTHTPLPPTVEEAEKRFIPPKSYREWKQKRLTQFGKTPSATLLDDITEVGEMPQDLVKLSRALTHQFIQEMSVGLIQEMHDKLLADPGASEVEFWTTYEARHRCLRIISKIGGPNEKRRAHALFHDVSTLLPDQLTQTEAQELYWQGSRYPQGFLPLVPMRLYPSSAVPAPHISFDPPLEKGVNLPPFFRTLGKTCRDILGQELMPHPRALPDELVQPEGKDMMGGEIQRAIVTKANPKLTAHTVQSLLYGAELGWTTLTGNRSSVRAILKEVRAARLSGRLAGIDDRSETEDSRVAIWVVDPRSLAEGMSSFALP
ncbi:hypothetical protein BDN72DRAFT_757288 [Pluteus cervinus]|uniref:Uncharacterized protein n=1 Tax=Pluteus cervinus TaxID=181527 RepID=A0ACD3BD41_9AGAR|nr:hypothetical protein BDN72DRAFT_757288 [Pluteus cervinus]